LSIPAFRRVWAGATVSAAGDAASWVALVGLALGTAHASLTLLAVLYTAPVAMGGLAAGWALDRFDRRWLMIGDCVLRGAVFASIPVTTVFARPAAGQLYAVAAVYGLLKMVGLAGFPSLIPALVLESRLDQANALEGVTYGLASLVGAGLAGLAVAMAGADTRRGLRRRQLPGHGARPVVGARRLSGGRPFGTTQCTRRAARHRFPRWCASR
jgi:MFS family permease